MMSVVIHWHMSARSATVAHCFLALPVTSWTDLSQSSVPHPETCLVSKALSVNVYVYFIAIFTNSWSRSRSSSAFV